MRRVYSVEINGKTMESRNLKELLACAVSAKRNIDRRLNIQNPLHRQISTVGSSRSYAPSSGMAVVH